MCQRYGFNVGADKFSLLTIENGKNKHYAPIGMDIDFPKPKISLRQAASESALLAPYLGISRTEENTAARGRYLLPVAQERKGVLFCPAVPDALPGVTLNNAPYYTSCYSAVGVTQAPGCIAWTNSGGEVFKLGQIKSGAILMTEIHYAYSREEGGKSWRYGQRQFRNSFDQNYMARVHGGLGANFLFVDGAARLILNPRRGMFDEYTLVYQP